MSAYAVLVAKRETLAEAQSHFDTFEQLVIAKLKLELYRHLLTKQVGDHGFASVNRTAGKTWYDHKNLFQEKQDVLSPYRQEAEADWYAEVSEFLGPLTHVPK